MTISPPEPLRQRDREPGLARGGRTDDGDDGAARAHGTSLSGRVRRPQYRDVAGPIARSRDRREGNPWASWTSSRARTPSKLIDRAKATAAGHDEDIDAAIDKVADLADKATDGKFTEKIDDAAAKLKDAADRIDDDPKA